MRAGQTRRNIAPVALLTEGVDRNMGSSRCVPRARVALLTEGVDRNKNQANLFIDAQGSPSSRRAWIEMPVGNGAATAIFGRPPHGGRG